MAPDEAISNCFHVSGNEAASKFLVRIRKPSSPAPALLPGIRCPRQTKLGAGEIGADNSLPGRHRSVMQQPVFSPTPRQSKPAALCANLIVEFRSKKLKGKKRATIHVKLLEFRFVGSDRKKEMGGLYGDSLARSA